MSTPESDVARDVKHRGDHSMRAFSIATILPRSALAGAAARL
jgi:hypothetical protein